MALLLSVGLHFLLLSPALPVFGVPVLAHLADHDAVSAVASAPTKVAPPLTWVNLPASRTNAPAAPQLQLPAPRAMSPGATPELRPFNLEAGDRDAAPDIPEYVQRMAALTARIQGQWKLPRATQPAADFSCRARLRSDDTGAVEEVELENCDTSGAVRTSIALAIERARPLPLPQHRSQPAGDIVLEFIAYAQSNGSLRTSVAPAAAAHE